jgi:pimeloyl-ACP methyl ester carboxylesterase
MNCRRRISWLLSIAAIAPMWVSTAEVSWSPATSSTAAYGVELQGFEYPYPVKKFSFSSQRQMIHMAYMDVRPQSSNGRTAVLLHGKNYCAATWYETMVTLVAAGYRVIAPDQIG